MAEIKIIRGSTSTLLSTELNSLANNTGSALGTEVNNSTALEIYADFELLVTFGTNPTDGSLVELYIAGALDGTNYEDGSSTVQLRTHYVGGFPVRAVTSAQRIPLRRIPIPPCKYKAYVVNKTGQTTASSGNTVKAFPYHFQSA